MEDITGYELKELILNEKECNSCNLPITLVSKVYKDEEILICGDCKKLMEITDPSVAMIIERLGKRFDMLKNLAVKEILDRIK